MERVAIALALVAVAVVVAIVLERRKPGPPTQPRKWEAPAQLDRADFDGRDHPWLVAVFTSSTCDSCEKVVPKAKVLASAEVAVTEVPYQSRKDLHERYGVDVVPTLVVADAEGVVRGSLVGPASAEEIWAAVGSVRDA